MKIIQGRNVNTNYATALGAIKQWGTLQSSRVGSVLVADTPVVTVTEHPRERVLTDPQRDANPFFHLFECLWMLSGSNDATWLDRFVSDFSSRFAEPNGECWGAYGYRWRNNWQLDQLAQVVRMLRRNPLDRRVVISMWDNILDMEADPSIRDLPCNTHIYPRIRDGVLDITICCRSNDIIWGAYGANAVHFSFLQEYLAGMIGVGVGVMYQVSNNWHAYTDTLKKVGTPKGSDPYAYGVIEPLPIGNDWSNWMTDLSMFMYAPTESAYDNVWFSEVAVPMWVAHTLWKEGKKDTAIRVAKCVKATDWQLAAVNWMERRA